MNPALAVVGTSSMRSAESSVSFVDWTKGRELASIGTNAGSEILAFQGWRHFKEAFAPEIVQRAIAETERATNRPVTRCLDPFGGSGTTALACQFLGVKPTTIEINPFLADLIEAKLTRIDIRGAARTFSTLLAGAPDMDVDAHFAFAPATFVEPGVGGKYLFAREVAQRIANLHGGICLLEDARVARLLKVLLASASLEVCHATVSGKGRRYRGGWQQSQFSAADLDRAYIRLFSAAIFDLNRYDNRATLEYDLVRGDARECISGVERADVCVFSPPYPNSFDYTDVYNIELWCARYLQSRSDNTDLRNATLRSHVQIARDFDFDGTLSPTLSKTVEALTARVKSLWNKNIPAMIGAYAADMQTILAGISAKISAGGRVYMVVGDSQYAGVQVPVGLILSEISESLGFDVISCEPFRSMRASPQQGGRPALAETLITLQAPGT